MAYLRNDYPCVAFKASTQQQRANLGRGKTSMKSATDSQLQVSECLGAENLLSLLKNYSRSSNMKRAISVGIIGFPNVGKSSIINSLKRSRAVTVGAKPGITKTTQEVSLDKNIKLIDCPGIIFADDMSESDAALRNCLNIDQLDDFTLPVQAILARCTKEQLLNIYNIPLFADVTDFLRLVAEKRGKVLRHAVPDYQTAARMVVQDWNGGKIPYYCVPPEVDPTIHVSSEIMPAWSATFDFQEILEAGKNTLDSLKGADESNFVFAKPQTSKYAKTSDLFMELTSIDAPEEVPYRKESLFAVADVKHKSTEPSPPKKRKVVSDPDNPQINTEQKKKLDKIKKAERKADNKERNEMAIETPSVAFDFGADFWKNHPQVVSTPAAVAADIEVEDEAAFTF